MNATLEPPLHHHAKRHHAGAFHMKVDEQGIAWLTFDTPDSSANVFNEATLRELDDELDAVELDPSIHALVIKSAKPRIFIAGADLKAIRELPTGEVDGMIRLGQAVFTRLSRLPVPTLAAIHGACAGGGTELALACDVRLATDDGATRIGLPETQLGLIPSWGGCTRLPKLVGLRKALEIILGGKLMDARSARKLGLVDEVVRPEKLDEMAARRVMEAHKPLPKRRFWDNVRPFATVIAHKARQHVINRTRGLYAAPLKAIETIRDGLFTPEATSLERERVTMMNLARSEETARLIDLFFRKEKASKAVPNTQKKIERVAVIGAGVMGAGIAHWLASRGLHVLMCDIKPEAVAAGLARVDKLIAEGLKRRLFNAKKARETKDRLAVTTERVPLTSYDLVIEAATEDMALKKKLFADISQRVGPETILATNTSALSVTELAEVVSHPQRVVGLHFFNPVHQMPLVEVITHAGTSDSAREAVVNLSREIGKTPVVVKDSPGFVVNRILTPYLMEAVKLHARGFSAAVIDEAMLDFGMPMGPMRLLDEIGLDVAAHVARTLGLDAALLEPLIQRGHLGRKTGQGFYDHTKPLPKGASWSEVSWIQEHLSALLSKEARKVLDEKIAASAEDIDLAMVLGTGYPPFRGGPLAAG
jgi:3-hydroxyacyl-CoA dehydrogenase / enoyl-CoA hydratase / 3-hydroxybutyryl-CoA epimerase